MLNHVWSNKNQKSEWFPNGFFSPLVSLQVELCLTEDVFEVLEYTILSYTTDSRKFAKSTHLTKYSQNPWVKTQSTLLEIFWKDFNDISFENGHSYENTLSPQ